MAEQCSKPISYPFPCSDFVIRTRLKESGIGLFLIKPCTIQLQQFCRLTGEFKCFLPENQTGEVQGRENMPEYISEFTYTYRCQDDIALSAIYKCHPQLLQFATHNQIKVGSRRTAEPTKQSCMHLLVMKMRWTIIRVPLMILC